MAKAFSPASFFFGCVIGAALVLAWYLGESNLFDAYDTSTTRPVSESIPDPSGAVTVHDQLAGESVLVESVTVPPPGVWVAVREVNGSTLGNVLGATRVGGPQLDVRIALLRQTVANHAYVVQLYRDDGDGEFNVTKDSAYVDFDSGKTVIAPFKTN